jgi:hypothetical protein
MLYIIGIIILGTIIGAWIDMGGFSDHKKDKVFDNSDDIFDDLHSRV